MDPAVGGESILDFVDFQYLTTKFGLAKVFKDQGSKSHFSLFSCLPTQK
jgi:hypothetical protein